MFSATSRKLLGNLTRCKLTHGFNAFKRTGMFMPMSQHVFSSDNFMSGANANYIDQMYAQWCKDPSSVHASWQAYFSSENGDFQAPPTLGKSNQHSQLDEIISLLKGGAVAGMPTMDSASAERSARESVALAQLVRAYQTHGHLLADIDPLNLAKTYGDNKDLADKYRFAPEHIVKLLDPSNYGFTQQDMDREFYLHSVEKGAIREQKRVWKLKDLLEAYKSAYCGKVGVEFMHIPDSEICDWIRTNFEGIQYNRLNREELIHLYERLNWSAQFGVFTSQKFNTMKRFGLEGCESFIPGLKICVDTAVQHGARKFVIGMPHRGRLSVLANVVRKPLNVIFAEFQGVRPSDEQHTISSGAGGDVKYHLGTTYRRAYEDGTEIAVTLMPNPSHLEAVNPVVMGRVRAEQHFLGGKEEDRKKVVPIIVHGDAAMAGQGIVFETIQMAELPNYKVGGTIHVIVNNQVGFTTSPRSGRSGQYSSDVAKSINAPIFHVNADSPEDVAKTFRFAAEFRQRFGKDVVIDLIGYRKMGHNELDNPSFTQPMMYKLVNKMKPVRDKFRQELIDSGIEDEALTAIDTFTKEQLDKAYQESKDTKFVQESWMTEDWEAINDTSSQAQKQTGEKVDYLTELGKKISTLPVNDGKFHRNIQKIFDDRLKSFETGKGIDWGTAEALAFASLIDEGYHVRISGQDVERGTFSHRHAHVFFQDKDGSVVPINNAQTTKDASRNFIASNSHLSEYAVLGYEYGYASANPNTLVLWEAQFGDFANGAQIMIDQFVAAGETKWNSKNGLVMLLPHGYDGNGPEHSSCRIERYLQLSDSVDMPDRAALQLQSYYEECNMGIVNCTTAAQYFHVLRRQMRRSFRKPLIVVAPKKMLKFAPAGSDIEDFATDSTFLRVIGEQSKEMTSDDKVRKVVFCSGQVYYDLIAERTKRGMNDVALVRVEQLSPWPFRSIEAELNRYKNAELVWCQEENKNNGVWSFAEPRFRNQLKQMGRKDVDINYAGRDINASPSTGFGAVHKQQLVNLVNDALQ